MPVKTTDENGSSGQPSPELSPPDDKPEGSSPAKTTQADHQPLETHGAQADSGGDAQLKELERENAELRDKIRDLQDHVSQYQNQLQQSAMRCKELETDLQRQQSQHADVEHSRTLDELSKVPEFMELEQEVAKLRRDVESETEQRKAALHAWEQAERKIRDVEEQAAGNLGSADREYKVMMEQKRAAEREALWQQEQFKQSQQVVSQLTAQLNEKIEECLTLKVQLGSINAEIRAANDLERLRANMMLENLRTEFSWKENSLRLQLEECIAKCHAETLEKLKALRAVKVLSGELEDRDVELSETNQHHTIRQPSRNRAHPERRHRIQQELKEIEMEIEGAKSLKKVAEKHAQQFRDQFSSGAILGATGGLPEIPLAARTKPQVTLHPSSHPTQQSHEVLPSPVRSIASTQQRIPLARGSKSTDAAGSHRKRDVHSDWAPEDEDAFWDNLQGTREKRQDTTKFPPVVNASKSEARATVPTRRTRKPVPASEAPKAAAPSLSKPQTRIPVRAPLRTSHVTKGGYGAKHAAASRTKAQ